MEKPSDNQVYTNHQGLGLGIWIGYAWAAYILLWLIFH